jgi:hypothetical protein
LGSTVVNTEIFPGCTEKARPSSFFGDGLFIYNKKSVVIARRVLFPTKQSLAKSEIASPHTRPGGRCREERGSK